MLEVGQAEAVRGTYYEGLTAEETGKRLGVSASKATQLKQSGLRQLRRGKNLKRLKAFRDEIISVQAYHATGFNAWRYGGSSVEERIMIRLDELESNLEPKT